MLGLLVAILGLLAFVTMVAGPMATQMPFDRMPMMRVFPAAGFVGLFALAALLVQALFFYAFGQGIELLLALEESTRATAAGLSQLPRTSAPAEEEGEVQA